MNRLTFGLAAAVLLSAAALSLPAAAAVRSAPAKPLAVRSTYDPFAMKRAAEAPAGTKENDDFKRRQEIVKYCKAKVKPPKPIHPRSPHQPGDDDGNNGHGNDNDHDDDSNPGQGGGNHGTGHDNDHGNSEHGSNHH